MTRRNDRLPEALPRQSERPWATGDHLQVVSPLGPEDVGHISLAGLGLVAVKEEAEFPDSE